MSNDFVKFVSMVACAYCGEDDLTAVHDTHDNFYVKCQSCGAHGSIANTNAGAILLWNSPTNTILRLMDDIGKLERIHKASKESSTPHTVEDDFQHFLSYSQHSGDSEETIALLREAFEAAWHEPMLTVEAVTRTKNTLVEDD